MVDCNLLVDYDFVFAMVYCYVISRHKRNTGKNVNIYVIYNQSL
jgi:hypothetical protein